MDLLQSLKQIRIHFSFETVCICSMWNEQKRVRITKCQRKFTGRKIIAGDDFDESILIDDLMKASKATISDRERKKNEKSTKIRYSQALTPCSNGVSVAIWVTAHGKYSFAITHFTPFALSLSPPLFCFICVCCGVRVLCALIMFMKMLSKTGYIQVKWYCNVRLVEWKCQITSEADANGKLPYQARLVGSLCVCIRALAMWMWANVKAEMIQCASKLVVKLLLVSFRVEWNVRMVFNH